MINTSDFFQRNLVAKIGVPVLKSDTQMSAVPSSFLFCAKNFFWAHVLFCKCKESLRGTNNDVVVNASSALELLNEEPASHYKNNSGNLEKKSHNLKNVVTPQPVCDHRHDFIIF